MDGFSRVNSGEIKITLRMGSVNTGVIQSEYNDNNGFFYSVPIDELSRYEVTDKNGEVIENGLRDDLYIGLVIFIDDQKSTKYLIPSTIWNTPSLLFTESTDKYNEYGISLNRKSIQELQGNYSFDQLISKF